MHNSSMKIGLRLPQTGEHNASKENILRLVNKAENAGCFDSLWVLESLIWHINRDSVSWNMSSINSNNIDNIIDISKQSSAFLN
jgi:hypothetical protein